MEDGLVQTKTKIINNLNVSLNPCCNGRWSRTFKTISLSIGQAKS